MEMDKVKFTALFAAIIVIDQISKWYVFEIMLRVRDQAKGFVEWMTHTQTIENTVSSLSQFQVIEVWPFFNLVAVWNTGVSFGLLQGAPDFMPFLLTVFAALMSVGIFIWGQRATHPLEKYAALMISAGALGNAMDRFRFKAVADFVDLHVNGYHWPAFNVADAAIVLGAGLLIVYILFVPTSHKRP